jgi:hypothetical protein
VLHVRPVLVYTTLRLAAFAATAAILGGLDALFGLDLPALVLVAAAALLSGLISLVLLSRHRQEMSAAVVTSARRLRTSVDGAAQSEDDGQVSRSPSDSSSA